MMHEKHWYHQRLTWLTLLLLPLSWLFQLIVGLRRYAYNRGLFKSTKLPATVIVVGNITVGGTGKSPLVAKLAKDYSREGKRVGLVSRGYKGKAKTWPQIVDKNSDPALVGDEPVMLVQQTGLPMVVGPNRVLAAQKLIEQFQVDVIICDDGLQHYALARDEEIVVVDGQRGFGNQQLLPAGPLREPIKRLNTVSKIISNGPPGAWAKDFNVVTMQIKPQAFIDLSTDNSLPLSHFAGRKVHAVTGIGNPERFFNTLSALGVKLLPHAFPDHHDFTLADLSFDDDLPIVMTAKDAVKCRQMGALLSVDAFYLAIAVFF